MNTKVEIEQSKYDKLKWGVVLALIASGVIGNSVFASESLLYRVIAILILAGLAGFVALQTQKGQSWAKLLKDARGEMRRVVWPTRQETMQSTLMVLGAVVVIGLLLWGLDAFLGWIVSGAIG